MLRLESWLPRKYYSQPHRAMMCSVDWEGGGGVSVRWGGRNAANRWMTESCRPQPKPVGCRDCRWSCLIYTGEKAFFSLWKTS